MPKRLPTKLEALVSQIFCFTLSCGVRSKSWNHIMVIEMKLKHIKKYIFVIILGLPAVIVALSLGIAAGKDGVQSFVSDK